MNKNCKNQTIYTLVILKMIELIFIDLTITIQIRLPLKANLILQCGQNNSDFFDCPNFESLCVESLEKNTI